MEKVFAPEAGRTPEGWYRWPRDTDVRKTYWGEELRMHPAKQNANMILDIVGFVSVPGETILDPMSGTGTLMWTATCGRRVICIELEGRYYDMQHRAKWAMLQDGLFDESAVMLINTDCRKVMPIRCNHIVFSPPYASIFGKKSGESKAEEYLMDGYDYNLFAGEHPDNVGSIKNVFFYNQVMIEVYRLCAESVTPGGTVTVIIQDLILGGMRNKLANWAQKCCEKSGLVLYHRFKRYIEGSPFKDWMRKQGIGVVNDEDIIIMRRPE